MPHQGVLISKMFHPGDFEDGPLVLIKVRENLGGEWLKLGPVRKLLLLVRHPDVLRNLSVHSNLPRKVAWWPSNLSKHGVRLQMARLRRPQEGGRNGREKGSGCQWRHSVFNFHLCSERPDFLKEGLSRA